MVGGLDASQLLRQQRESKNLGNVLATQNHRSPTPTRGLTSSPFNVATLPILSGQYDSMAASQNFYPPLSVLHVSNSIKPLQHHHIIKSTWGRGKKTSSICPSKTGILLPFGKRLLWCNYYPLIVIIIEDKKKMWELMRAFRRDQLIKVKPKAYKILCFVISEQKQK